MNIVTPIINSRFIQPTLIKDGYLTVDMDQQTQHDGKENNGILEIKKTSTNGLIDTYTIYFTDGSNFDYFITNGLDGSGSSISTYEGSYKIIPKLKRQTINTFNMRMKENFIIEGISYTTSPNETGLTIIIGE